MKSLNRVTLLGHLGNDPEFKQFEYTEMCNISLATSESYKDKKGEWQTTTQWHRIVAWGKKAELFHKYCKKGDKVYLEGKLNYRSYENNEGMTIYVTEIVLTDFSLFSSMKGSESAKVESAKVETQKVESKKVETKEEEDDLPF